MTIMRKITNANANTNAKTNGAITDSLTTTSLILRLFLISIATFSDGDTGGVFAWTPQSSITTTTQRGTDIMQSRPGLQLLQLQAKKRPNSRDDPIDDMSSWYDPIDDDATPDQVFFQEMERQRLTNQVGGDLNTNTNATPNVDSINSNGGGMTGGTARPSAGGRFANAPLPMATFPQPRMGGGDSSAGASGGGGGMNGNNNGMDAPPTRRRSVPTMDQIKIAEATLSEYEKFKVSDNWLNEELQAQMWDDDNGINMATTNGKNNNNNDGDTTALGDDLTEELETSRFQQDGSNEPWDDFGDETKDVDYDRRNILEAPFPTKDSEFYFDPDLPIDIEEVERSEKEFSVRMKDVKTRSNRLEKAKRSPTAKKYFHRGPNKKEGYEHLWVAAVDNVSYQPLIGNLRDYGVEFADNFGDFEDHSANDGLHTIEDMASWKARQVYAATGLPTIASRSSFEIEPVLPSSLNNFKDTVSTSSTSQAAAASRLSDPRVVSGYRINDIANHVDYLATALKPLSEPDRVTRFTSCFCYYDGEIEIFEHGVLDCDLYFCNSMRTCIPLSQATNHIIKTLQMTFGLVYQKFLKTRMDEALFGDSSLPGTASVKLRDRVLKDGRVLPNDIIDVSKFMDSQVDVDLMDACAQELSQRFVNTKPTKIMTVATTGLVIALPMAKYLQVPVVYARKERNVVMADTYSAPYSSKTVGKNRQLLVSKMHVHKSDRVLIIDDFLSSGSSQEALLRILSDAGAEAVGIGVLLEKAYDSGRQSLSGYDIPIQSLCRVASVEGGVIQLVEEDGFDKMKER